MQMIRLVHKLFTELDVKDILKQFDKVINSLHCIRDKIYCIDIDPSVLPKIHEVPLILKDKVKTKLDQVEK